MARSNSSTSRVAIPRFAQEEAIGAGNGFDGSDGGGSVINAAMLLEVFPAVYDDGGVVKRVGYISNVLGPFVALFAAAGFTVEDGFIVNDTGAAYYPKKLLTSTSQLGPLPFGTVESSTTLTKDGLINVSRLLVRLGP